MVFFMGGQDNPTPPPAGTSTSTGTIGQYQNQYGVPPAGAGPVNTDPMTIFLGSRKYNSNTAPAAVRRGIFDPAPGSGAAKITDINSLLSEFEQMDKEKQRQLALQLVLGGYNDGYSVKVGDAGTWVEEASLADVMSAYSNLLSDAANHYAAGQQITPDQLLKRAIGFRLPGSVKWDGKLGSLNSALVKAGISVDGDGSQAGTFTEKTKNKTVDFMDPMDAKALARGVLQQELGREPTQAEYEDFLAAIHAAEAHNPNVTTSTTTYQLNEDGRPIDTNTSTTTHAGITGAGLAQVATEKAQSNPNWAEWQAMGTYAPALFAALSSAVPGA